MRPDLVVIRSVCLQDIAQVRFAEHDEVACLMPARRLAHPTLILKERADPHLAQLRYSSSGALHRGAASARYANPATTLLVYSHFLKHACGKGHRPGFRRR
jgi:hypothetical protein